MSSQILFNQFAYSDRLKAGGFTDEQARASADALGAALTETVATSSELAAVEARLDTKINAVEARLNAKIDAVSAKIDLLASRIEAKLAESNVTVIKWLIGTLLTMAGLFSAGLWGIVKYLH